MKDIEILENMRDNIYGAMQFEYDYKISELEEKEFNALNSAITALKENQAYKDRTNELEEIDSTTVYIKGRQDERELWMTLIQSQINELYKKEQELQDSISEEEREEYSDANISYSLMDIDIRRSVLQGIINKFYWEKSHD